MASKLRVSFFRLRLPGLPGRPRKAYHFSTPEEAISLLDKVGVLTCSGSTGNITVWKATKARGGQLEAYRAAYGSTRAEFLDAVRDAASLRKWLDVEFPLIGYNPTES